MRRDVVMNLLHNVGGRREVDEYIRAFTEQDGPAYAVVKVGGALLESSLEEVAASLALLRRVGMAPVVVHGAGPQLSRELESRGIECEWVDGRRVTGPDALEHVVRVLGREASRLATAIDDQGARARAIATGVFGSIAIDPERLGLVGSVGRIELDPVADAVAGGYIPVLSPLGTSREGLILNINADDATGALASALRPRKILFLTGTGGLLDGQGRVIPAVNLAEDGHVLLGEGIVRGGMRRKLEEIALLLDGLPDHCSVSITSPEHVARELFTHSGCGTLVRKGVGVTACWGVEGVDRERLGGLLEESFARQLDPSFWERVRGARFFVAGDYTAAGIVRTDGPVAYLDKLAVTEEAKGSGIGAALWRAVVEEFPEMVWRSRASNRANGWYLSRADGMERRGRWLVFWIGALGSEHRARAMEFVLAQPESFVGNDGVGDQAGAPAGVAHGA